MRRDGLACGFLRRMEKKQYAARGRAVFDAVMTTPTPTTPRILQHDPWFTQLPPQLRERLLHVAVPRALPARRRLFSKGDPTSGLFALLEGAVKIYGEHDPGHDGLIGYLSPPAWFGEVGLFDGLPRTHTIETAVPCQLLYLPLPALRAVLREEPAWWSDVARLMAQKLRLAFFVLDDMTQASAHMRVVRRILMLAHNLAHLSPPQRTINIQQEQLSQMLGLSRQTVNPILRQLATDKVIEVSYGRITIQDLDRLKDMAHYDHWLPTWP